MLNANTSPKVSIIMPTYNRAKYIIETIESIRNQTYSFWELIIVDDGSDDNSEELISQIKDERIQFYKAGRIGINGRIKNIGLEKVSGELIAFIDSDDLWTATKLEKQVAALQQYPEAGFSLTGGYNFKKLNEPVDYFYKQRKGIKCADIFISIFKSQISATTPSLMLLKNCIDVVGLFQETNPFSDIDFILSLAKHFKAVILYEPLLYRRLHDSNDSNANWKKGYDKGLAMIHSYKKDLPSKIVKQALFKLYINFGEDCLLHKERKRAIENFFQAWRNKPFNIVPLKKTSKTVLQWMKNK
jgi:glycosyltransferase involved in cell wall biosynthesis